MVVSKHHLYIPSDFTFLVTPQFSQIKQPNSAANKESWHPHYDDDDDDDYYYHLRFDSVWIN